MNSNELIGTILGKALGYLLQGVLYSEIAKAFNPRSVILFRTGAKYTVKVLNYTSTKYIRTDFKSETIFSDAIDASFFAD